MRTGWLVAIAAIAACGQGETADEPCDVSVDPSCVAPGDSCDDLPAEGLCDGTTLLHCESDAVVATDCARDSLVCGALAGDANACVSACALAGIDDTGACSSETEIERCVDGAIVLEMCGEGTQCSEAAGEPVCQSAAEACADVGPQGRCEGDILISCASGWPTSVDCDAAGEVCAYADDALGYQCIAATEAGPQRITGRVDYEDRPISPGAIGDIELASVRGANVWLLRDADDAVLAHAVTADDGSFTLRADALGTSARVTTTSSSQVAARPLRVTRSSGNSHAFGSDSFSIEPNQRLEIIVTEASQAAQAFNIFDNLVLGMDYARSLGAEAISPLTARWQRGAGGGSYYQGGSNFLNIAGGSDDDGYDDVVILHEFGHYHQDEYGGTNNPGGPHPSAGGDDPRLAWAEGQATYIAMVLTGLPYYIDTNFGNGGWFVELEANVHSANISGSQNQFLLEWMVAELLWDVGDSGEDGSDSDADPMTGEHDDVMRVTTLYFHDPSYVGRGFVGVDLVDWLDGWFWHTDATSCDAMRTLVHDKFGFPYDFAPCQ